MLSPAAKLPIQPGQIVKKQLVEGDLNLFIWKAEAVLHAIDALIFLLESKISRLPEESGNVDVVHVKGIKDKIIHHAIFKVRKVTGLGLEEIYEKTGVTSAPPVRAILLVLGKEEQYVEWIVDRLTKIVVAIILRLELFKIYSIEIFFKGINHLLVRITAKSGT